MARLIDGVKDTEENDLDALLASWKRSMRAERKSPDTIRSYLAGVEALARWCAQEGRPVALSPATLEGWTLAMLGSGASAATVILRQRAARRFSAWLAGKGIIEADLIDRVKPPKLDEPVVPALTGQQLRALLATCDGKAFHHVRDRALIMMLAETGARAAEVIGMEYPADLNLDGGIAVVRRGKGGKGGFVPFSPQTAEAIEDYLRLRKRHRLAKAGSTALWLGDAGRQFNYSGLYHSFERRGHLIGFTTTKNKLHPHMLRHTAAVRWLDKGGSPTGLMAIAGWTSIDMLRRYIRASEANLAAGEARRLNLGDF